MSQRITPVVFVLPDSDFLHHGNDLAVRVLVSLGEEIRLHFDYVVLLLEQPLLKILNLYVQVQRRVVVAAVAPASAALKRITVVSMSADRYSLLSQTLRIPRQGDNGIGSVGV